MPEQRIPGTPESPEHRKPWNRRLRRIRRTVSARTPGNTGSTGSAGLASVLAVPAGRRPAPAITTGRREPLDFGDLDDGDDLAAQRLPFLPGVRSFGR